MAWSDKSWRKMFNCGFYSPSVLQNSDLHRTNSHTCKTSSKSSKKIDVASLTSFLSGSPAIVGNASILSLLKCVFICWCEYYLTLSSTPILLGLCIQALRDWRLSKESCYLRSVDVNDLLQEQEIFLLLCCPNFASVKEGFFECLHFTS